ncbi:MULTISPECIES: glycosyltransferase family 2 protein [Butyricimonas]|uniref:glycosyltransferase family 2 protein n=1 Tax=Butyricimonas TaxID=574697 RepID=UPI001D05D117|nr:MULTISPECIES: glycosyltransferase family 2 protein [Butyricimonas]MCB6972414.1 glycosyltransferase family 2 protein [Butyricimonas synergistica]MCG4519422.1 glycosyltransferase family 2 protein [Butyricimonas sp. DFI.6.44]
MNISLILCTRNRRDILIHNLGLYANQLSGNDEVIIVDSSDEPKEVCVDDIPNAKSNIRYYHTRPGLPLQRNYGIKRASCDLVMFLDDDIYLYDGVLDRVKLFFVQNGDFEAVTGALSEKILPSPITRVFQFVFGKLFFTSYFGKTSLTPGGLPVIALDSAKSHVARFLRGGFSVYRRGVFEKIQYDEHFKDYAYLEDTDFSHQFNAHFKAYFLDSFKGFHAHESTSNKDQSNYRKQYVLNYVYIYKKHHLGSAFKMNWVLFGLIMVNGIKSLMERNYSFYKGTLQGIRQMRLEGRK